MKQISRRKAPKPEKQKPTHLIAMMEPVHGLTLHAIVNAWEHKVHGHTVCWRFVHPSKGIVDVLPCQIKILRKITITKKKKTNDISIKAGDRALALSRSSRGIDF